MKINIKKVLKSRTKKWLKRIGVQSNFIVMESQQLTFLNTTNSLMVVNKCKENHENRVC